jgi:hypothetical protein
MAKPDISEALGPVQRGFRVLSFWPEGLHYWLDQYRTSEGGGSIHRSYQGILDRLRQVFPEQAFAYLFDEVRQYLRISADIPVKRSSFFYSPPVERGILTGVQAAKELGTTVGGISRMIRMGKLSGESRAAGSRSLHLVKAASIKRVQAQRSRILSADEASARLGVSVYQIKQLNDDLLHSSHLNILDGGITTDAINKLVGQLAGLSRGSHTAPDLVRVSDIPRLRSVRLGTALRRILDGSLPLYEEFGSTQPYLARFQIRRSDLLGRCIEDGGEFVSVRVAAKHLGVSVRMIPILVKSGCLVANMEPGKTLQKVSVSFSSIRRFQEKFIMTKELAAVDGTSTKRIIQRMRDMDVSPVVTSEPHKGISAVWDRSAIKRYL